MAANLNKTESRVLASMRLATQADQADAHGYSDVARAYTALYYRQAPDLHRALAGLERKGHVAYLDITGMGGTTRCYMLTERS